MSDHKECCGGHCQGINLETPTGHKLEMSDEQEDAPYMPTEQEEEELEKRFFCLYHLKMQWSEYDMLTPFERDWVIQRFLHQKKMEKELAQQYQHKSQGGILIPTLEI